MAHHAGALLANMASVKASCAAMCPDECWYCGLCQSICPVDAIEIVFPRQMAHNQNDVVTLLGKVVDESLNGD